MANATTEEILQRYVDVGDCWLWTGTITSNGYGVLRLGGRSYSAHRWVWEKLVGPIPEGLTIDHLCRARHCVNPDHLDPVAIQENIARGFGASAKHKRQTHCKRGHALVGSNLYVRPDGKRECHACRKSKSHH